MDRKKITDFFDRETALFLATLSGVFSAAVVAGLLWYGLRYEPPAYFDEDKLAPLRENVRLHGENGQVADKYREEDFLRRQRYLQAQSRIRIGARLLFAGLLVFALSMRRLSALTARTPVPAPLRPDRDEERKRRWTVGSVLAVSAPIVVLTLCVIALTTRQKAPPEGLPAGAVMIVEGQFREEVIPDSLKWPAFRGSSHQGIVEEMPFPLSWNAATNENILWKTKVPLPGHSSPIVWGEKLFLTGADREARKVFCFECSTGRLMWTCAIRSRAFLSEEFEINEDTGLAAPTPATDGKRVFAFFGTGELAAVDFLGNQVWSRWFGRPESAYGLSSSPIVHEGKPILQLDQGSVDAGKSFLYALDPENGNIIWKTPRPVPNSWSSPIIIRTPEREELITCAAPFVISYDPLSGKELWRAKVLRGDVAPLPVYADGIVYATNDNAQLAAIRTGGSGDVTQSHVVWTHDEDMPDVASPITDGKFFLQAAAGYAAITCYGAKTGKVLWQEEFDDLFWSSPSLVGRRVYWTDMVGKTYIFELSEQYKLLGTGDLGEEVVASPAFADSRMYFRAKEHLYCIGFARE